MAVYFTLYSAYNRYGCWGLTDDYTNPDRNFKMQAVRKIISQTTSTDLDMVVGKITIYPDPAQDYIGINTGTENHSFQNSALVIYNISGKPVMVIAAYLNKRINISDLPVGFYIVKTGRFVGRFVKI